MYITSLGGHSGCKVLLCEAEDDTAFVRKISSDIDYNERLKIQAQKQKSFQSTYLKAPKVYATGYMEDGLYYFDMEYIQGITLAEKIKTIEIGKIRPMVERIILAITKEDICTSEILQAKEVFCKKIDDLEQKLKHKNNPIIDEAIRLLKEHDWSGIGKSQCHGDLTLENIIIQDNQLYLIDFLDSFYDSWILDVSTMLQDVLVMWSYRKEQKINNNTLVRLILFKDILMDILSEKKMGVGNEVYYALLLKLIRIYPYTTDQATYEFLNEKTMKIIEELRGRVEG